MTEALGLFLSGLLSATLLPGSSEALLIALLIEDQSNPTLLIASVTVGNILGSVINWYLGRYLIHFQSRKWFPVQERDMQKAQKWYSKFGVWSLLFAWLPIIGDPLTLIAGLLGVRLGPFLLLVSLGKFARYMAIAATTFAWI